MILVGCTELEYMLGLFPFSDCLLCLRLQFDVKEAKVIEHHPQWDISDDDEADKDNSDSDADSGADDSDSDFEYLDD